MYCSDGSNWRKMNTLLPEFINPDVYDYKRGGVANIAISKNSDGIIITGASTDGYGDTFLVNTENASDISIEQTDYTMYGGLSTSEIKNAVSIAVCDENGEVNDGIMVMRYGVDDDVNSYYVQTAQISGKSHLYKKRIYEEQTTGKKTSKAVLSAKKKTVKRGKSYKIKIKKLNGQKYACSVSKKTKKKGVSVTKKGLIKVKKKAKTGTYTVKVKVKANKNYKSKTLRFKLKVKK